MKKTLIIIGIIVAITVLLSGCIETPVDDEDQPEGTYTTGVIESVFIRYGWLVIDFEEIGEVYYISSDLVTAVEELIPFMGQNVRVFYEQTDSGKEYIRTEAI